MDYCSRCHKITELPDGTKYAGIRFSFSGMGNWDKIHYDFYRKQLGKYASPKEDTKEFVISVCFECWLDSIFLIHDKTLISRRLKHDEENNSQKIKSE